MGNIITFDGTERIETAPRTPFPSGLYLVQVESEAKTTSTGKPAVMLRMQVLRDHNEPTLVGRFLTRTVTLTGNSPETSKKMMDRTQMMIIAANDEALIGAVDEDNLAEAISNAVNGKRFVVRINSFPEKVDEETNEVITAAKTELAWDGFYPESTWSEEV